ncbi:tetratricopeptide repeat protein [Lutibacter sp.]|uniref:tetratricopeptide repeat-containing sensor histidine kinase n=1 Tax=Lutibacter sp. TaxID=1925666 RepID=UPI0025C028EA|nr:tetratricopeptide repeat protein [Lutibacter sp.]MCF6168105.1 tetratricopeptide repeat protein [Lutibacter sp.]
MGAKFKTIIIRVFYFYMSLTLVFCSQNKVGNKTNDNPEIDSISNWIQQSKNIKKPQFNREKLLRKAFEVTKQQKLDSVKNKLFSKIALEVFNLGNDELFRKVNLKALLLATKLRDTFRIGEAHWNYGSFYSKREMIDSAYYHYHEAYKYFKIIKNKYYTAKMLYNMGYIEGLLKDYTGSEVSIFEAITIFKKLGKDLNLYQCYNYLGLIYYNLKEFNRAIYYHNKALEYLKNVKNKRLYKEGSLSNLGLVYQKLKDYEKAIESFEEALNNSNLKKRDINFYARLVDNIAYTRFLDGDTTNVAKELYKSLKIRDSVKNISGIVVNKLHLAELYALKQDTSKAIKLANEAHNLANKIENNRDKLKSLLLLSKIDAKKSNTYLKNYVHLNDSLQIEERKIRNKFTRIRFETDEYIRETEKLSAQKILISVGAFFTILILSFAYFLRVQRTKNKELLFEREQQKSNEEIFSLMLKQQSKLEEGRLKERHRISEDLHDGVLGKIFGTRIGLGFLNIKGDEGAIKKHQFFINELQNIEKEIRTISHELKNEILSSKEDFFKIIDGLIEQKSNLGNFEYKTVYDNKIHWSEINDGIKINLYRILQEALQNIIKYANANNVKIEFKLEENTLILLIEDDGIGFNVFEKRKGIGIKNMKSRVRKLNGVFEINSTINKGTTIFVSCPIQN